MIKRFIFILSLVFVVVTSCDKDDYPMPEYSEQTVFMYLPWSGNLTSHFKVNITDLEASIMKNGLNGQRVIVFLSTSPEEATLFEIVYRKGNVERNTLKNYSNPAFTTAEGITSILNDVKSFAPNNQYAMTIGCHGMGWIPVSRSKYRAMDMKMHWDYEGIPMTRYFGGTSTEHQTDITTLAEGITNAGIKMQYILFDDCYMSTVEVAYELKNVTDYLIGCPTEVMAYGMPYEKIGQYLIGNVDYNGICNAFLEFYNEYTISSGELYPHGTIGVTKCSELDKLAEIMNEINKNYTFDSSKLGDIQKMDGYTPVIFFDFGDYVSKLCPENELLVQFRNQLDHTVPYKKHTEKYYSMINGQKIPITTFSGITVSDPSTHHLTSTKKETAWYKATHN